jgi:hypothetical protein
MLSWLSILLVGFVGLVLLAAGLRLIVRSIAVGPDRVTFTAGYHGVDVGRLETTDMKGTFNVTIVSQEVPSVGVGGRRVGDRR